MTYKSKQIYKQGAAKWSRVYYRQNVISLLENILKYSLLTEKHIK